MSKNLETSSPILKTPTPNSSRYRRAFKCPLKSPHINESSSEESPTTSKRKFQELNSSYSSSPLASTPKSLKSSKSRHLAFHSPFQSPVIKSSKETEGSLKGRLDALLKREADLDKQILELKDEGVKVERVQEHIDQLHKYNEVKDSAQIVLGRLAEMYGISLKEIHTQYGAPTED